MKLNHIYTWLRHPGEALSQRVVHAGFWAFALRIVSRLFGLARTILLARLLAPNDFGLYGIALLSLSALETFSQTGFDQALIQKKEDTKPYLDTAWTVQVIRGFVLASVLFLGAPLVGSFFGEPRAVLLVRVLGAAVFLKSLRNIGIVYFRKELEFHKQFIYEFSGTFADLAVAIPAAFILRSVWALVFGLLAGNLVRMVVSYFIHPYRPRFRLDWEKGKELIGFGKYIFVQSIVLFLLTQGDDAFVGKVIGATALGFYQLAYRFSNMAATEITHVVSQVTFPAYSKLQDQRDKLRKALSKTLKFTAIISIPLASGIAILSPEFTRVFLGEKWMPMVPAMQVMCVFGAMRAIGATFGPIYLAIGRLNIPLKINVTQLVLLAAIIYPLTSYWGIFGTAIAITLCMVVALCLTSKRIMEILDIDFVSLFKSVFFSVSASSGMVMLILLSKTYVEYIPNYASLLILFMIGVSSYLGLLFAIHRLFGQTLRNPLRVFRGH